MTTTPTAPEVCPGCGGRKTTRAQVCKSCRRKANAIGVTVVTHVREAAAPEAAFVPRTPWQSKAYHAKCNDLARITKADMTETKENALSQASAMFDRPLTSSTALSEIEMELLLEWLDREIAAAKNRARLTLVEP